MSAFTPVMSYDKTATGFIPGSRALSSWPGAVQPYDLPWYSWPSMHGPSAMEYASYWPSLSSRGNCGYLSFQPASVPLNRSHEKPSQSYIGLIAEAILSSPEKKLVLSDIYNYILTNWPYFRTKGTGWRNSIRHNLSLNDCFVKTGRSPNGKGHFWTISPLYYEDFCNGDYGRRSSRRVPKYLKLAEVSPEHCNNSAKYGPFSNELKIPGNTRTREAIYNESNETGVKAAEQRYKKPFDVQSLLAIEN